MEDNRTIHKRTDFLGLLTSRDIDYGTIVFTGDRTIDYRTNDYRTIEMARFLYKSPTGWRKHGIGRRPLRLHL